MRNVFLSTLLVFAASVPTTQAQSPSLPEPSPSTSQAAPTEPSAKELKRINSMLSAFGVPLLCDGELPKTIAECYRLLWVRAFDPPVLATVTIQGSGNVFATYAQLSSDPQDSKVSHIESTWVDVCAEHANDASFCEDLTSVLHDRAAEELWSATYGEPPFVGVDGSDWILEGRTSSSCHTIKRWSPAIHTDLFHFFYSILTATGKRPYFDEVY